MIVKDSFVLGSGVRGYALGENPHETIAARHHDTGPAPDAKYMNIYRSFYDRFQRESARLSNARGLSTTTRK
jgi:hypothetical protein